MKKFIGLNLLASFVLLTFAVLSDPSGEAISQSFEIPTIRVADTINPGTADYIIANIEKAEKDNAPYFLLLLDTPGGLLTATREIVKKMLNATLPIVVYVSPRGAHAGSAGAIITFASDIAVMAPGTNIGAAHPVVPGNQEKIDKTMNEKMANDTAAFAESLAKTRGRNTQWAIKAVKESASLIAEEALKKNVIDLIASDLNDLATKLPGFVLKAKKNELGALPQNQPTFREVEMTIKQKLVSFFANPNIAYLLMSLAGLCIWVELTNPGLIIPGVIGGFCVILSGISFQLLPIHYGALAFMVGGLVLLIAEAFIPSFGIIGISGIVSFIFGSLFLMDTDVPEFQISLGLIIPTAASLALIAFVLGYLVLRSQKRKVASGLETFIGEFAEVKQTVSAVSGGTVFVHGELWQAVHEKDEELPPKTVVKIKEVRNMKLVVEKHIGADDVRT